MSNCTFVSNTLLMQKEKSFSHGQLVSTQDTGVLVVFGACFQPTSSTCLGHWCASPTCLRHCSPVSASASLGLKKITTGCRTHGPWLPQVFCGAGKEAEDDNSHRLGVDSNVMLSLGSVSMGGSFVGTSIPLVVEGGGACCEPMAVTYSDQSTPILWNFCPAPNRLCLSTGIFLVSHLIIPHNYLKSFWEIHPFFGSLIAHIFSPILVAP